ncbi:MAG: glycoside hydrolase family 16 protein [Bacilli bacterium]|nr:glycoside hydrolase family 16 protein [Bacilli bacterium]
MKKVFLFTSIFTFMFVLSACEQTPDNDRPTIPSGPVPDTTGDTFCAGQGYSYDYDSLVYDLVWNDEFDGDTLDLTKWTYEINGNGGGNQELQYYTNSNTSITDGILSITAKNETYEGREYTSSRIVTRNNGEWTYGIFEARIKLPGGLGTWPAFWMMPTISRYGGWPDSGEIDIMEQVGYAENIIHGTIHTEAFNHTLGTQKGGTYYNLTDAVSEFHVYKVEWLPDRLRFFVDDINYFTYRPNAYSQCATSEEWPFDADFFLILNVAVGGTWGGAQGVDPLAFPVSMEVDYVRVYQSETITNIVQGE